MAFKEWAGVVHSLGQGDQVFVLRKGGIADPGKAFSPDYEQFFLFPTFFHEQARKMKPGTGFPETWQQEGVVVLQYYADLVEAIQIRERERLEALHDAHVWSAQTVEEKFSWGKEEAVYLLVLRVYRLREVMSLPLLPAYQGCRSWIELEADLPSSSEAVLTDAAFAEARGRLSL